jgi:hypothetical protein
VLSIADTGGGIPADLQPVFSNAFSALIKPVPGPKTTGAVPGWDYPFPAGLQKPITDVWN